MENYRLWFHSKNESDDFIAYKHNHNLRAMKIVLLIFIFFDSLYYFSLGKAPGGYLDAYFLWLIPITLSIGLFILIWIFFKKSDLHIWETSVFVLYVLGSRVLYGGVLGFNDNLTTVYVGLMLLLSALFFFNWRFICVVLFLQLILHIQYFFFHLNGLTAMTLLVTNAFAFTSAILSIERYTKKLQSSFLNKTLLEKNKALERIQLEIRHYNDQMTQQLKRTSDAESLFKGLLDHTDAALMLVDLDNQLKYYNDGLRKMIGYGFEEIHGELLDEIIGSENATIFRTTLSLAITNKKSEMISLEFQKKDGAYCFTKIKFDYIDLSGNGYILVNISDYTEEAVRQKQIIQLSQMKDVVLAINHKLAEDSNLKTFFDYVLNQVKEVMPHGDLSSILLLEEDQNLYMVASNGYIQNDFERFTLPLQESFAYRIAGGNLVKTVIINDIPQLINPDYVKLLSNEHGIFVYSSISGPILKDGKLFGLINIDSRDNNVFTTYDISIMEYLREQLGIALSLREMYKENLFLSRHDQLTGFMNRWYLNELELTEVPRWHRHHTTVVIASIDLNNLKILNDRLGHHQGDAYICLFSSLMKTTFRSTDIIIRLGGDEFAGVFFEITPSELVKKLDTVNQKISDSALQQKIPQVPIGFAYGIVPFDDPNQNIEIALQIADLKMYDKKNEMKNT